MYIVKVKDTGKVVAYCSDWKDASSYFKGLFPPFLALQMVLNDANSSFKGLFLPFWGPQIALNDASSSFRKWF